MDKIALFSKENLEVIVFGIILGIFFIILQLLDYNLDTVSYFFGGYAGLFVAHLADKVVH